MRRDRDDLLKAAARYFSRGGFRTTSMQEVAEALDVSRSSLYYHFTEKTDLLYEILILTTEEFCGKVGEIVDYPLPARQRMALLFRTVLLLEMEIPSVPLSLILRDEGTNLRPEQRTKFVAKRDEYEALFRRLLREGTESGEFRVVNTKLVTFAILAMLEEFDAWFNPEGPLTVDAIAEVYADFVLTALSSSHPNGPASDDTGSLAAAVPVALDETV